MYYIAVEIRACYAGMILAMALATDPWQHDQTLSGERLAKLLLELAANVDPKRFRSDRESQRSRSKRLRLKTPVLITRGHGTSPAQKIEEVTFKVVVLRAIPPVISTMSITAMFIFV